MKKLYARRDPIGQGEFYTNHLMAMTAEGLHEKSDIAKELAHRDIQIYKLQQKIMTLESHARKGI